VDQLLAVVDGVGGTTAVTQFLPFLGYYLPGWLLMTNDRGPRALKYGAATFTLGTVAIILGGWVAVATTGEWGPGAEYVYDFLSPMVVLSSVGAFLLLRTVALRLAAVGGPVVRGAGRVVGVLSGLSFGVYLVHVMVLNTLRDIGGTPDGGAVFFAAGGYAAATALISLLLVAVARRIPFLRATVWTGHTRCRPLPAPAGKTEAGGEGRHHAARRSFGNAAQSSEMCAVTSWSMLTSSPIRSLRVVGSSAL